MINISVFASGRGTNFRAIHEKVQSGYLRCKIALFITDNPQAGALNFAKEKGIPAYVIRPRVFPSPEEFGNELLTLLRDNEVQYIVLAGYLKKIPDNVVDAYQNRIFNIHPALLPSFGGKGLYGMHVHRAVFDAGVKVSGVTVHLVNKEYDAGPIVLQRCVDISRCTSPEEIAEKILPVEHQVYPEAIKMVLENEIVVKGKRVIVKGRIYA